MSRFVKLALPKIKFINISTHNVLRFVAIGNEPETCRKKMPFDFSPMRASGWAYRDCFTIDPSKGAKAWEQLNRNQLGLEIGMLPKTLHDALIDTLKERKTLEGKSSK